MTLESKYLDWYNDRIRRIKEGHLTEKVAVTEYLTKTHFKSREDKKKLFKLFQFLTFLRTISSQKTFHKEYLGEGDQAFYNIKFPLNQYLRFLRLNQNGGARQNQVKKEKAFFESLIELKPVESFSDRLYRSYVIFPLVTVQKKGLIWVVQISVAEQLLNPNYPFYLPEEFLYYKNSSQLYLLLEIYHCLAIHNPKKIFYLNDFLKTFHISNSKKTEIKKFFIDSLQLLVDSNVIRAEFQIHYKTKHKIFLTVQKVELLALKGSNHVCFYEDLESEVKMKRNNN